LVLVPIVTPNYDATVAVVIIAMIPTTVPAAIMPIEFSARTIVTVPVVVTVAAYVNAEALGARYCWCSDGYGSERGQSPKELSHSSSSHFANGRKQTPPSFVARNTRELF
jgi:hypothetical protein